MGMCSGFNYLPFGQGRAPSGFIGSPWNLQSSLAVMTDSVDNIRAVASKAGRIGWKDMGIKDG